MPLADIVLPEPVVLPCSWLAFVGSLLVLVVVAIVVAVIYLVRSYWAPSTGRHAARGTATDRGNVGRHFVDNSPTNEIRLDGSWRA